MVKNLPKVFCERSKSSRSCIIFFETMQKNRNNGAEKPRGSSPASFADDVILELGQWNKRWKWLAELASRNTWLFTREAGRGGELAETDFSVLPCTCWVIPFGMEVSTLLCTVSQKKKNPPFFLFCCSNSDSCFHRAANDFWLRVLFNPSLGTALREVCASVHLCVRICVSAASCSSGRPCRTGRRRTCRCPSSSSSSSEAPSQSRSAPRRQKGPRGPASPPGGNEKIIDVSM